MNWGNLPTSAGGGARELPYVPFNNSNIKRFAALPDQDYTMTILCKSGWEQPVQAWGYSVSKNGNYMGSYFARNKSASDKSDPFANANDAYVSQNIGVKVENKNKPFPIKCEYLFPVVIDEVPNEPFLLYGVSQKGLEAIQKAFQLAKCSPETNKLIVSRIGKGLTTTYSFTVSPNPVSPQVVQAAVIPEITPETYKDFLMSLEDPYDPQLGLFTQGNGQQSMSKTAPAQTQQAGWGATPQGNANANQQATNNNPPAQNQQTDEAPEVTEAKSFVVQFGPYNGKSLGELDQSILQIFSDTMDGELKDKSLIILNGCPF